MFSIVDRDKPWLLTGSPRCDPFSSLQGLSKNRADPEKRAKNLEEGREGLRVAAACYLRQHRAGRYFLHEHPAHASSWNEGPMKDLGDEPGVFYAQGPMCRWGMRPHGIEPAADGVGEFVRKETGFYTNSWQIYKALDGRCSNFVGDGDWHRHVPLLNGLASFAAAHPPKMVAAVLKALRRQLSDDGQLGSFDDVAGPVPEAPTEYLEIL